MMSGFVPDILLTHFAGRLDESWGFPVDLGGSIHGGTLKILEMDV